MRLAQFARVGGGGGDTSLYGLPEMEIGRSTSNLYDSNPSGSSWPVGSKGGAPLTAASIAAAAAATSTTQPAPGDSANPSPNNNGTLTSPTGELDTGGRKSNRSSRTAGASPTPGAGREWGDREGGGGMGAEAAAQAFTEEAELEALQIDKNDLKLVFGRPFARGKSSEVYQVTHAGKNRAAKVRFWLICLDVENRSGLRSVPIDIRL